MKDHCHIPAPHFHCNTKYSLIEISGKSWHGARSDEFKDQEQGEISVCCTVPNHLHSHCRSFGFIDGKLCCTERLSFTPRIYKPESHSTTHWTLPPYIVNYKAQMRRRQEKISVVQEPLCFAVGLDWVGHAAGLHNFMVQALLPPETEDWIVQTVLWLKSSAASPELSTHHRICTGSHRGRAYLCYKAMVSSCSCSTQLHATYFVIDCQLIRSFLSQGNCLPAP